MKKKPANAQEYDHYRVGYPKEMTEQEKKILKDKQAKLIEQAKKANNIL